MSVQASLQAWPVPGCALAVQGELGKGRNVENDGVVAGTWVNRSTPALWLA